tara:strand:- start:41 stop:814 length:774 start_codon:yes stop_codon:yes gene_type:complete
MVYIENFKGDLNATRASGLPEYLWYAKSCDKPGFSIEMSEHKMINKTFKYPKTVTWDDVSITMVDTDCPSVAELLGRYLEDAGGPAGFGLDYFDSQWGVATLPVEDINTTVTKVSAMNALGKVKIWQLDPNGRPLEEWQLHDAWIKTAKFGKLDYESDGFMEIEITIAYDWATVDVAGAGDSEINGGSRMSWWTSSDVAKINSSNAHTPSLSHIPDRNAFKQADANSDGRPDILEDYIDTFTAAQTEKAAAETAESE